MTRLFYIPVGEIELSLAGRMPPKSSGTIADRINELMYSSDTSEKTSIFINRASEILGIDPESDDYLPPSNVEFSDKYPELVRQYMALRMYRGPSSNYELRQELTLAVNDSHSTIMKGQDALYEVFQSIHGDVSITKTELSTQRDLFEKEWEDIMDNPSVAIRAYQETTPLVCALLVGYMRGGFPIEPLIEVLKNLDGKSVVGCNAADAGTKEDELVYFKKYFDDHDRTQDYIGINISSGNGNRYSTRYDNCRKVVAFGIYEDKEFRHFRVIMEIPIIDIPKVLSMLCIFSGRSGESGRLLIDWYIQTYNSISDIISDLKNEI